MWKEQGVLREQRLAVWKEQRAKLSEEDEDVRPQQCPAATQLDQRAQPRSAGLPAVAASAAGSSLPVVSARAPAPVLVPAGNMHLERLGGVVEDYLTQALSSSTPVVSSPATTLAPANSIPL